MNWQDYIVSDEHTLVGKPRLKGTRLSLEFIMSLLAGGWTENQLFENYPTLTPELLQAVYAFMYDCLQDGLLVGNLKAAS